jgi:hypothetical protein
VFGLFVEWALLTHKTLRSLAGLGIVALGIPIFYLWRAYGRNRLTTW